MGVSSKFNMQGVLPFAGRGPSNKQASAKICRPRFTENPRNGPETGFTTEARSGFAEMAVLL